MIILELATLHRVVLLPVSKSHAPPDATRGLRRDEPISYEYFNGGGVRRLRINADVGHRKQF